MEQVAETTRFYLENLLDDMIRGRVELHQVPHEIAAFYYLGEAVHIPEVLCLRAELSQALADRERYYRAASRGGFGVAVLKPQGKTFAELEALRRTA